MCWTNIKLQFMQNMLLFICGYSTYYDNIEFWIYFLLDMKYIFILQNFRLKNYEFT